ncbi:MAG TPA: hypothetical protein DCW90_18315 [Lachnospiraceae bacterium]|nr:hypothetical protein [Lachnospiraceae bacterium]
MNELELRIRVQNMVQSWVEAQLQQVPAYMMEDAMNKTLVYVKELALQEFIQSATKAQEKEIEKPENQEKEE